MVSESDEIVRKAREVLRQAPLCNRCLGRLFASYGVGLTNPERGRALKTLVLMELHREISAGRKESIEELKIIAENGGPMFKELVSKYVAEPVFKKCSICGGRLDSLIGELAVKAVRELEGVEYSSFIVGVRKGSRIESAEEALASSLGITSWESVRREVKREVGKKIQFFTGRKPDFRSPEVVITIDLDREEVFVQPMPVFYIGSYVKLGRNISQMRWVGREGRRNYPFSVEESLTKTVPVFEGDSLTFHASGREDADARMLGDGRPLIIEVKNPRKRNVPLPALEKAGSTPPWVYVRLKGRVRREDVTRVKSLTPRKLYLLILYSPDGFTQEDVRKVEEFFRDRTIRQRTPERVLRRRADIVRERNVYSVRGRILGRHIAEFTVMCDGGLYVKELAHGDKGRTDPSFSSLLSKEISVLFLDVLGHESVL